MEIVFSEHANIRLKEKRQRGITRREVIEIAKSFPGKVNSSGGFKIKCGRIGIVITDRDNRRIIVSIIGA